MYVLLDRRNSNAYNDRVWMHRGIYLLSKKFLVTPENIFHNILITNPLLHKVNNETSFQNSVQIHVFAQVSLTAFIFVCVLQNSHTLSSHFLCLCMSLFEPLKTHVSVCMYKTSFNTHRFCWWWMHFTTLVLQSPSPLLTLFLLCSFTCRCLQHLFQDF